MTDGGSLNSIAWAIYLSSIALGLAMYLCVHAYIEAMHELQAKEHLRDRSRGSSSDDDG